MRSCILDALSCKNSSRPPIWLMRQAGRYMKSYQKLRKKHSFIELCLTPELAFDVTMQPVDAFDVDAAILFSDILLPLSSLGYTVRFGEKGPTIDGQLSPPPDIEAALQEKIGATYTAATLLSTSLDRPLIGFAGAPWTLAAYLIEGGSSKKWSRTKKALQNNLEEVKALLLLLEPLVTIHLKLQLQAGCSILQLFDSQNSLVPPQYFEELCLAPLKRILSQIEAPLIYFKADSSSLSTITHLSLDHTVPLENIRDRVPKNIALQGNLDPSLLQDPQRAISTAKEICACMQQDPGFIFNLSGGIPPTTKEETIKKLVETVQNL